MKNLKTDEETMVKCLVEIIDGVEEASYSGRYSEGVHVLFPVEFDYEGNTITIELCPLYDYANIYFNGMEVETVSSRREYGKLSRATNDLIGRSTEEASREFHRLIGKEVDRKRGTAWQFDD